MAESYGNSEGIPERERPWKRTALEPITTSRVGRWRRELSPAEIQDLEWLGCDALLSLGYPLANPAPEPASRLLHGRMVLEVARCLGQFPLPVLWKEAGRVFHWIGRPLFGRGDPRNVNARRVVRATSFEPR